MADGNVEFLGREDDQIKIRGCRVEMGEIKNLALQNSVIKEAIVVPDKSDRHNIKIILFITTYKNKKLDLKDLKREFSKNLPEYMIPSDIIHYAEFPVTLNNKIDTKTLLSDYNMSLVNNQIEDISNVSENFGTLTPTEQIIHNIWSDALKIKDFSIDDNFFEIGGNSLLAIFVFSKIKSSFDIELSLRVFFDSPRIKDLAEAIDILKYKSDWKKPFDKNEGPDLKIVEGEI
jgi:acyl carrier protein